MLGHLPVSRCQIALIDVLAVGRRRIRHGKLVSPLAPLTSDITRIDDTGKKAVVTMVQNDAYVINALVLGYTLQKYNPSLVAQEGMDFVALLPTEHDLSSTSLDRLRQVGWQLRFEEEFLVNGTDNLPINYRRNFFKLNIWAWEEYVKMAYLDADCMVRGDITLLLSREYSNVSIKILVNCDRFRCCSGYLAVGYARRKLQCWRIVLSPVGRYLRRTVEQNTVQSYSLGR